MNLHDTIEKRLRNTTLGRNFEWITALIAQEFEGIYHAHPLLAEIREQRGSDNMLTDLVAHAGSELIDLFERTIDLRQCCNHGSNLGLLHADKIECDLAQAVSELGAIRACGEVITYCTHDDRNGAVLLISPDYQERFRIIEEIAARLQRKKLTREEIAARRGLSSKLQTEGGVVNPVRSAGTFTGTNYPVLLRTGETEFPEICILPKDRLQHDILYLRKHGRTSLRSGAYPICTPFNKEIDKENSPEGNEEPKRIYFSPSGAAVFTLLNQDNKELLRFPLTHVYYLAPRSNLIAYSLSLSDSPVSLEPLRLEPFEGNNRDKILAMISVDSFLTGDVTPELQALYGSARISGYLVISGDKDPDQSAAIIGQKLAEEIANDLF